MGVRIITQQIDTGAAAAGVPGARAEITTRTFIVESAELEDFLCYAGGSNSHREVIGAELVATPSAPCDSAWGGVHHLHRCDGLSGHSGGHTCGVRGSQLEGPDYLCAESWESSDDGPEKEADLGPGSEGIAPSGPSGPAQAVLCATCSKPIDPDHIHYTRHGQVWHLGCEIPLAKGDTPWDTALLSDENYEKSCGVDLGAASRHDVGVEHTHTYTHQHHKPPGNEPHVHRDRRDTWFVGSAEGELHEALRNLVNAFKVPIDSTGVGQVHLESCLMRATEVLSRHPRGADRAG